MEIFHGLLIEIKRLTKRYEIAKELAVEFILQNYPTTIGIVVGGSVVRNEGDKNSDLDIYVVHSDNFRQRVTKFFNGVPCDIFINTMFHIKNYFIEEHKSNRPVTADMISTGTIVYGVENQDMIHLLDSAKTEAKSVLVLALEETQRRKYELSTLLEDVEDVLENNVELADYILQNLMIKTIDFAFLYLKTPLPRAKNRLKVLATADAEIGKRVYGFYGTKSVSKQYNICKELIILLLKPEKYSGLEWITKREYLE